MAPNVAFPLDSLHAAMRPCTTCASGSQVKKRRHRCRHRRRHRRRRRHYHHFLFFADPESFALRLIYSKVRICALQALGAEGVRPQI